MIAAFTRGNRRTPLLWRLRKLTITNKKPSPPRHSTTRSGREVTPPLRDNSVRQTAVFLKYLVVIRNIRLENCVCFNQPLTVFRVLSGSLPISLKQFVLRCDGTALSH